jgi:hypothetical protein
MRACAGVTDAAFAHLRGIHTLDMAECEQAFAPSAAPHAEKRLQAKKKKKNVQVCKKKNKGRLSC